MVARRLTTLEGYDEVKEAGAGRLLQFGTDAKSVQAASVPVGSGEIYDAWTPADAAAALGLRSPDISEALKQAPPIIVSKITAVELLRSGNGDEGMPPIGGEGELRYHPRGRALERGAGDC